MRNRWSGDGVASLDHDPAVLIKSTRRRLAMCSPWRTDHLETTFQKSLGDLGGT
jgi:hypothetical protein